MKNSRRTIVSVLLVVISCGALFATTTFNPVGDPVYSALNAPFTKTSARVSSMGGAGLAVFNNQDALYMNPASLGEKGLVFNLPNVSLTLYNIKDVYVDSGLSDALVDDPGKLTDQDFLTGDLLDSFVNTLTAGGRNRLATIDAGVGMKLGRFAFGLDSQINLNTYNTYGVSALSVIPQVDVAATFGLGFRFFRDSAINLDVGVSAALQMRAFMEAVSIRTFADAFGEGSKPTDILGSHPVAIGWAVPLTVGVNINFPFGFTIANVVSNIHLINGGFNYVVTDYNSLADDYMGAFTDVFGESEFVMKSPVNYSVGLGWAPDLGWFEWILDPTIAIDVVDVIGLVDDFSTTNFLMRLKAGVELQMFKAFELRAGLNGGYVSIGGGINLFNVIHCEVAYYWNEFGDVLGEKDVDALTIRFNIGWER